MLGKPVRWIEDRREHLFPQRRSVISTGPLSLRSMPMPRSRLRGTLLHDHGAYTARGLTVPQGAIASMSLAYVVPAFRMDVEVALTNKVPVTPVRGAGQPQGVFVMERLLDRAAKAVNIGRDDIRLRNLVSAQAMPYKKDFLTRGGIPIVLDTGNYPACQADALASGWTDFPRQSKGGADAK